MTKYDEMCQAAATATAKWLKYRERCWSHMALLVNGFMAYCGIPTDPEKVTFLKWNEATGEKRAYVKAEEGMVYTLLGATDFDSEDGYWHLGVCINLNLAQEVFFPLCVTDHDGKLTAKLAVNGKARQIDPNDAAQLAEFYEGIVETIKQAFSDRKKPTGKPIGFVVGP